jgi:hypothetical protein
VRTDAPRIYRIGEVTVTRATETVIDFVPPKRLLPDWTPDLPAGAGPIALPVAGDHFATSVHSWVVKTPDLTILVDTESATARRGRKKSSTISTRHIWIGSRRPALNGSRWTSF